MPKRGVFTKRRVTCSLCRHLWYVEPRQVGSDRCPKCAGVTRLKGTAALEQPAPEPEPTPDERLKVDFTPRASEK